MVKNWYFVILVGIISYTIYSYVPSIHKNGVNIKKLEIERDKLLEENGKLTKKIENYEKTISEFDENYYVEKIARNRLYMVKEDEKIYRIVN